MKNLKIISFVLAGFLFLSCGTNTNTNTNNGDASNKVEQGKEELSSGRYLKARASFMDAFEVDSNNNDARYGRALAELMVYMELVGMVNGYQSIVPGKANPTYITDYQPLVDDEDILLNKYIEYLSSGIGEHLGQLEEVFSEFVEINNYTFSLSSLPLFGEDGEVLDLGGVFGRPENYIFLSIIRLLGSIVQFIEALDLDADYPYLLYLFENAPLESPMDLTIPFIEMLKHERYPRWLTRDAVEGRERLLESREYLTGAFEAFYDFLDSVIKGENAEEGLFYYHPDIEEVIFRKDISKFTLFSEESHLAFQVNQDVMLGIKSIISNLKGEGDIIRWRDDILPILISFINMFFILMSEEMMDREFTETGILTIVPDFFGLDLYSFFEMGEKGLRGMLPAWSEDKGPGEDNFLMEWECDMDMDMEDLYSTLRIPLFCPFDSELKDSPHFEGEIWANVGISPIPVDRIECPQPYMAFLDPSFSGMLYLNLFALHIYSEDEFKLADNYSLNAVFCWYSRMLKNFLQPFIEILEEDLESE